MELKRTNMIWGIFLILIGGILLIGNMSRTGMELLWPIFPLAAGVAFFIGYLHDRKNYGLLMPGSILVVISLLFFYCNFTDWWRMEDLWPIFILAPAVGFVLMYIGGNRDSGLLVPAGILSAVGIIFLSISHGLGDYWPILLIIAGVLILVFQALPGKKKKTETDES